MNITLKNKKILDAGYYFIGHYKHGELRIKLDCTTITIPVNNNKKINALLEGVFDIDTENGVYFNEIVGKYCRIAVDEHFNIVGLYHIIEDRFIDLSDEN